MWYWYINGEKVPYQNRTIDGVILDMRMILNDWTKGQMIRGLPTDLKEIKLSFEEN